MEKSNRRSGRQIDAWCGARKIVQFLSFILFLLLAVLAHNAAGYERLSQLFFKLDPLTQVANALAGRALPAGFALSLVLIASALLLGRVWCGWMCPLGTLLDMFPLRRQRSDTRPEPAAAWRRGKYITLLLVLFMAMLGSLTLLVFDPLTLFYRMLAGSFFPALDRAVRAAEQFLYRLPGMAGVVTSFDRWLRPFWLPAEPLYGRSAVLLAAVILLLVMLNLVATRFWCRYLCPLGGLLAFTSRFSIFRRSVNQACTACGLCEKTCPTGAISAARQYASDTADCTLCLDCFQQCPEQAIELKAVFKRGSWKEHDPDRRHVLVTAAASLTAVSLLESGPPAAQHSLRFLQPPGGRQNDLLSHCIRCGLCVRSCPTGVLQPSLFEAGLEGLWTPLLVPRLGYCDYSCNTCGQVCPVQAIPALSLEEKRQAVIGKAYVDTGRCIAWADRRDCIVCEEMCPLPEKAIKLESSTYTTPDGNEETVNLPYVERDICIGCGICEYQCPVGGESAIRVALSSQGINDW